MRTFTKYLESLTAGGDHLGDYTPDKTMKSVTHDFIQDHMPSAQNVKDHVGEGFDKILTSLVGKLDELKNKLSLVDYEAASITNECINNLNKYRTVISRADRSISSVKDIHNVFSTVRMVLERAKEYHLDNLINDIENILKQAEDSGRQHLRANTMSLGRSYGLDERLVPYFKRLSNKISQHLESLAGYVEKLVQPLEHGKTLMAKLDRIINEPFSSDISRFSLESLRSVLDSLQRDLDNSAAGQLVKKMFEMTVITSFILKNCNKVPGVQGRHLPDNLNGDVDQAIENISNIRKSYLKNIPNMILPDLNNVLKMSK